MQSHPIGGCGFGGRVRHAWRAAALAFGLSGLLAGPAIADSCKPDPSCRP